MTFNPSKLAPKDAIRRLAVGEMEWPWPSAASAGVRLTVRRFGAPDPKGAAVWDAFAAKFLPAQQRAGVLEALVSRAAEIEAAKAAQQPRRLGERAKGADMKGVLARAGAELEAMSPAEYHAFSALDRSDGGRAAMRDPDAAKLRVAFCYLAGGDGIDGLDLAGSLDDRLALLGFDGAKTGTDGAPRYYTRRALAELEKNNVRPAILREFDGGWRDADGSEILSPEDGSDTAGMPLGEALAEKILEFALNLENAVPGEIARAELDSPGSPGGRSPD